MDIHPLSPDFGLRAERLRSALDLQPGSAFITVQPADIEYLTGLSASPGCLVLGLAGEPALFLDESRWNGATAARPRATLHKVAAAERVADRIVGFCTQAGLRELVCEDLSLSLAEVWQQAGLQVRRLPGVLSGMRRPKDAYEQAALRRAARLADSSMAVARAAIRAGVSELQVAAEVEHYVRAQGAEGTWFPTAVNSGQRSAHPVYPATRKVIDRGDLVVVDIGVRLDGYCGDLTRTFIVGEPGERQLDVLRATLDGQAAALTVVRAGVLVEAVDRAAREVFASRGYGAYVTHPVGHGLGLAKEAPNLAAGVSDPLIAGECVTVEPGIYIPGFGGARIEDEVIVTDAGAEIITHCPKTLDSLILP